MKVFHCDHCEQLLFFENVKCMRCSRVLAYVPELGLVSLDPAGRHRWTSPAAPGRMFRLCKNYEQHDVCNGAIPVQSRGASTGGGSSGADALCRACRLTRTIPNLSREGNARLWYKLETAKRRLVYTLDQLGLPYESRADDPKAGLAFDFLEQLDDVRDGSAGPCVLTGHREGVITINIAEADDAERVKRRTELDEPYRTVLGHFRHEVGHYYWDRLIRDSERLEPFRALFGDERDDYQAALQRHYQSPPVNWQNDYVSAYATMHPWEDWAETWAHYLHMSDTLETAAAAGISLTPPRKDEPTLKKVPDVMSDSGVSFDRMMKGWAAITYVLNNLNRGLGNDDAYPFVLSLHVVEKLRFVHETIGAAPM